MNTRVDFYLLNQPTVDACHLMACRIIEKAYQQGHRIYVLCQDNQQAQVFDKLLWTFTDISFLPHGLQQQIKDPEIPILIGDLNQTSVNTNYDLLINLSSVMPEQFSYFQRVCEMVSNDPKQRLQARERYKIYRQHNCELHSHQLG